TLAFETVISHKPAAQAIELVRLLASAAGQAGMVGGQVLDIEAEAMAEKVAEKNHSIATAPKNKKRATDIIDLSPLEKVEGIHRRKTGALITCAVEMGAVIGKADRKSRQALVEYGRKVGLAFQVKDDILDIEAPQEKLGKSSGKDAASQKLTYPAVMGLEGAKMLLRDTIIDAKKALEGFGNQAMLLRLLADFIAERDH
ncbi:MAG: polyprenyl synthetase family protein, partial [Planctomycetes bacterium]|nr:polyprenyl synthetase family protein [Planctomycetota bacterium]